MTSTVPTIEPGEYRAIITGPHYKLNLYSETGEMILSQWVGQPLNLDNRIETDCVPCQQGAEKMATKINRTFLLNGVKHWVHANTEQEYVDKLQALLSAEQGQKKRTKTMFAEYAQNWFETYGRPNVATVTANTYRRQLTRYLLPAFGKLAIEDITVDAIQRLFNQMDTTKATKDKVKLVLNQILEAAKDDRLIEENPLSSRRLRITGKASRTTQTYSVEQMKYLLQHIDNIQNPVDRAYLAIQMLHPLRLEEVLGLQWRDLDIENRTIHISRAVSHPTRNQPEVKDTKTSGSARTIGLSPLSIPYLDIGANDAFLFGGEHPLSYSQIRRMCARIQKQTGFSEPITPIRFRTTVLTDIYNQTKDIKLTQAAAGHTTANMTLKYYVKGRENVASAADAVRNAYLS